MAVSTGGLWSRMFVFCGSGWLLVHLSSGSGGAKRGRSVYCFVHGLLSFIERPNSACRRRSKFNRQRWIQSVFLATSLNTNALM